MSQGNYYEPDAILARIKGHLEPYVLRLGGQLSIATDSWHFLELLAESPGGFLCALHWAGEHNTSDLPADAGVFFENLIEVGVSVNLGLTVKPGTELIMPRPGPTAKGRPPLLKLVPKIRNHVRALQFPNGTTGVTLTPRGTIPVTMPTPQGNVPLAAYKSTFALMTSPTPVVFVNPTIPR